MRSSDKLKTLRREIDRLEADFSNELAVFDRQRGYLAEGATSSVAWLVHNCGLSAAAAMRRVETARRLEELPATRTAFEEGRVSTQQATIIARTAGRLGIETFRPAEPTLLQAALTMGPDRLAHVADHIRHQLDSAAVLADANRAYDSRCFNISRRSDGVFRVEGQLDAEGGATLKTAIDALIDTSVDGARSPGQKRADALVELASRQLRAGLPSAHGARPHLAVTTTVDTLRRVPESAAAEILGSGTVPGDTARRLACDASITDLEIDGDGNPLDVGRTRRKVPATLRQALVERDRGCRFPGCDRPPEWTDAHHIEHWADGGRTRIDNLVLLCRRHHRRVHEGRWRLFWRLRNELVALPP